MLDAHLIDFHQWALAHRQRCQFAAPGQRLQQLPGVLGLGRQQDVIDRALLHRLAMAHHHHFMGIARHQ
ncbi:hypothetical protein D3C72_2352040 [compost metagenome]